MDMKKLLESMDNIEECGTNEGMPMVPPMPPQPAEDKGNPVSMNVSLNASGKDHVEDLIKMMKNAGMNDAQPVTPDMMPMRRDMERLRDIVDEPNDMDDLKPGMQDEPCPKCGKMHIGASNCMDSIEEGDDMMDKLQKMADGPDGEDELLMRMNDGRGEEGMYLRKLYDKVSNKMFSKDSGDLEDPEDFDKVHAAVMQMFGIKAEPLASLQQKAKDREISGALNDPELTGEKEGYDNEPDEQYGSIDDIIDTGDDLHKSKKAYKATQDGDNPMALEASIREELYKAIQEKMAEGRGRGKKKDKKTTEGRGKVMAGRGRGKVMASRGRGKDKLMAGRGRGKKK